MNSLAFSLISATFIGLGATMSFDVWGIFLKYVFNVPPSNICLLGRWIRYMQEGVFRHSNLASAPQKSRECAVGWIAHYTIGITFALAFVMLTGSSWLRQPSAIPAVGFGMVTVLAPFLIMQPLFGLGFAASKVSDPFQARLRSLMNHTVFGVGLYLFAMLANWVQ